MITKPRAEGKRRPPEPREPKKIRRQRCKLESCNQLFSPIRSNQLFCSTVHKDEFRFKSEGFRRTKEEVLKFIAAEVPREVQRILPTLVRQVYLALETSPPPALVERIAQRIIEHPTPPSVLPN